ncbi:MAG: anion permease, partial [Treponema sp.]|nr:anion permease [Treponema sp.]
MKNKSTIGLVIGIAVAILIYLIPIQGLSSGGHIALALTLMTVLFWVFQIAQPAYVSIVFLTLIIILGVVPAPDAATLEGAKLITANATATAAVTFRSWTGQTLWLIVGAYLIAAAVQTSGLGQRIAYNYMLRFVRNFRSVIIGIFVLTLVLSLLIPQPWPRALMIMSVMSVIIKSSNIPKEDGVKIGFAVFAASVTVSLIFMTGDATINVLAATYAGGLTFLGWFTSMGVPALVASTIALIMILVMFKPTKEISVNKDEIREKIKGLGKMTTKEIKTLVWIVIAIL